MLPTRRRELTSGNTTDIPQGRSDPPPLRPAPARVSIYVLLIGESPGSVSCWWLQSPSGCPPSCRRHYWLAALGFLGSESFDTLRQRYVGSVAAIRAAIATNQSRVTPTLLQGNAPCAIWTGFAIQLDSNSRRPATRPRFAGGKRRQILAPKRLLLLALGESDR